MLPNVIIVGVNKAGTTSLFTYLTAHAEVCGSVVKETCYFLPLRYGRDIQDIGEYRNFFSHCQHQKIILESTPGYFYGGAKLARAIKQNLGDIRIVIVLRDPVSRFFSFFRFKKSMLELPDEMTIVDYFNRCSSIAGHDVELNNKYWGIDGGFYGNYLEDWFGIFGDKVRVAFFEHMVADRNRFVQDMFAWFGLTPGGILTPDSWENMTRDYRSRILQSVALNVNRQAEPIFRRFPGVKRLMRRIYFLINGSKFDNEDNEGVIRTQLKELYKTSNKKVLDILVSRGYDSFPDWLIDPQCSGEKIAINSTINGTTQSLKGHR